jgi:hypothetical protein
VDGWQGPCDGGGGGRGRGDGGGGGGGRGGDGFIPEPTGTGNPDEVKGKDPYDDCKGKIAKGIPVPSAEAARAISQAARAEGVAPEDLAVTASAEAHFNLYPINGPHGGGTADIGPTQMDYAGLQNWSGLNGLTNVFGTNTAVGQQFNGDPVMNLRAAARLINDMGGGKEGTIHWHSGTGPWSRSADGQRALRDRKKEYEQRAPSYKAFFDCLRANPFGFY